MVSIRWFGEARELAARGPVEVAAVNDDASHTGTMATNPLRTAMGHNVCPKRDWPRYVAAHSKGVVDDERDAVLVGNIADGFDVWHTVLGVRDRFDVNTSRVLVNGFVDVLEVVANNPFDVDLEFLHIHAKLVVCSAVQPRSANKVVSRFAALCEGHELISISWRYSDGCSSRRTRWYSGMDPRRLR